MTYEEAIQFLYDLRMFGAKLGLENTLKLAALAGNPQERLRFIHVAGTNGKGSTCAMLESTYRTAGLRVGLFTSPHLVSFSERIQVNRELIPEGEVVQLVREFQSLLKQFPSSEHPTFFEVVTVMALKYFATRECDLVIWETGLGGRLDATNIVLPLASVITNVQRDHQKWLGETVGQIATEKAGIIKSHRPVVTAAKDPEALEVIRHTARTKNASLTEIGAAEIEFAERSHLTLPGQHQVMNAALAVATVRVLQSALPVSDEQMRSGLANVFWPGRLQMIKKESQTFLLDGAHNPAGVDTFIATVREQFQGISTLVVGVLGDKDWEEMCSHVALLAKRILLVPVQTDRTVQPLDMMPIFQRANRGAEVIPCASLREALERSRSERFVAITGSLYLIGEAMELLGVSPARSERGLNEWQPNTSKLT